MTKKEMGLELVAKVLTSWGYTIEDTGKNVFDYVLKRPTHDRVLVDVYAQEKTDGLICLSVERFNHYSEVICDDRYPELRIAIVDAEEAEIYASTFKHMVLKAVIKGDTATWERDIFTKVTTLTKGQADKLLKL